MTPRFTLNSNASVPAIGIGCWMGRVGEGEHVTQMLKAALEIGYRHIDTASNYGNEHSVGRAIRESAVPRSEIFLTTKLAGEDHGRVAEALDDSLAKLGVDYVDLFLMHWPQALTPAGTALQPEESPTIIETWREMEHLVRAGKARSIGVSNFSIPLLSRLLASAPAVPPSVNQVEIHPCLPQHALLAFCRAHRILLTAYSPLGKHTFADAPEVARIAAARGVSAAQVLLAWAVGRGTAVVPKSLHPSRMRDNLSLIELTPEEMRVLDALHEQPGMHHSVAGFHRPEFAGCFGWTYEQLGWDMLPGGVVRGSDVDVGSS